MQDYDFNRKIQLQFTVLVVLLVLYQNSRMNFEYYTTT